jgi:hypothetical protein
MAAFGRPSFLGSKNGQLQEQKRNTGVLRFAQNDERFWFGEGSGVV